MLDGLLARCRFPVAPATLRCAVSGGADSLALLALACSAGHDVTAIHVDHGLRPGSDDEADVVAAAAARFGAGFLAERVDLDDGPNLEARARAARFAVLPADVATGHTADDRAETILLNLLRSSGPSGVAVLRPGPRHPIAQLRRTETVALCAALGLHPVQDPSNLEGRFLRNRVRAEVLPLLAAVAGRDVVPLLCRHGDQTASLVDFVASLAADVEVTDAHALRGVPEPVASAAVRSWLREGNSERHPPDLETVRRVLRVARGDAVATDIGGGRRVRRSHNRLILDEPSVHTPQADGADEYP